MTAPFYREAGSGPGVVCLHSNASTSGQWRALMDRLAAKFHVLAADLYGAGKTSPWHGKEPLGLRDEIDLLEPVFARAGDPFVLVGHSYGAAVCLIACLLLHILRRYLLALARAFLRSTPKLPTSVTMEMTS